MRPALVRRWALGATALLAVGVVAWWMAGSEAVTAPTQQAVPAVPALTIAVAAAVPPVDDVASAVQALAPPASAPRVDREFVDVCGFGKVRRSELEQQRGAPQPAWMQAMGERSQQALPDLARRLDAAGSLNERVAAAVLRDDAGQAAQLAASGGDVEAYRMAMRACRRHAEQHAVANRLRQMRASPPASGVLIPTVADPGEAPGACGLLSLERLEAMDGADAWPWLLRLDDSLTRADEAATTQALYQLGQRDWAPFSVRALGRTVALAVGDEPSAMDSMALSSVMTRDMSSARDGAPSLLLRACQPRTLDANRRQLCEQAVRRLAGAATETSDGRALYALEERLGLPHHPQTLSPAEQQRGRDALQLYGPALLKEPTCATFTAFGQQLAKLSLQGELAYMRARRATGAPPPAQ